MRQFRKLATVPDAVPLTMVVLGLGWTMTFVAVAAEPHDVPIEIQVKAAFIYNFAKFVEWPGNAGVSAITFCVFGDELLAGALERTVTGKTIEGHILVVNRNPDPSNAAHCDVAFIGGNGTKGTDDLLQAVARAGVLTVGDGERFAQGGGMIQLIRQDNKLRFAVNVDSVGRYGVRVSSKLLQLAEVVHESGRKGRQR
jgi:hypothetical protein